MGVQHMRGNEKDFGIRMPVLVFRTRMGNMPGMLQFWWTEPFWITKAFNGSYQLGTLTGEILNKWVNGFRLKPYKGRMPEDQCEAGGKAVAGDSPTTMKPV